MAAYGNPGSNDSMYSDAPEKVPGSEGEEPKKEESESPTALLPKSILAGKEFKPGDEVVLKIVSMHEDEVEVEYATEEKPEKESAPPVGAGDEMGRMME